MYKVDRSLKRISIVLVLLSSFIAMALQYWKVVEYFDWVIYDLQMPLWSEKAPDDVLIIAIDEKSIAQLGRWPWSRRTHAKLIDRLSTANTGPIIFDVLFSEFTSKYDPVNSELSDDDLLAKSMANNKKIILPVAGIVSPQKGIQELLPIEPLFQAAHSLGHTDLELDSDSKFRRVFLYAGLNDARWPNLSVAALMANNSIEQLPGQRREKSFYGRKNAWVRDYYVIVPIIGKPKHFHTVSYSDVLDGSISLEALHNKTIFIGMTARGLAITYPTPLRFHQVMSGVEIQANIYESVRSHNTISELSNTVQLLITFSLAFLGSLLFSLGNWTKNQFYLIALIIVVIFFSESLLLLTHIYIPIVSVIVSYFISSLFISSLYLKQLKKVAETDFLTDLYNRHFFDINFSLMWKKGYKKQSSFSLLIIDIDYFKAYNDAYGHAQGDLALKQVAQVICQQSKRFSYKACRIGGEEFACLIENCTLNMAKNYAEKIRKEVELLAIEHKESEIKLILTVSIGVGAMIPNGNVNKQELFKVTDDALYHAKKKGRNQVADNDMNKYIFDDIK
jgi:diguanylate cyclase (GGDEF)-like protein